MLLSNSLLLYSIFSLSFTLATSLPSTDFSPFFPRGLGGSKSAAPPNDMDPETSRPLLRRPPSGVATGLLRAKEGKIGCGGPDAKHCMKNCYCSTEGEVLCDKKLHRNNNLSEWMKDYHIRSLTGLCGPVCSCMVNGVVRYGGLSHSEMTRLRHDNRWLKAQMEIQEKERQEAKAATAAARRGGGRGGGWGTSGNGGGSRSSRGDGGESSRA
ncbi:hypothetical protein MMC30_004110 [Trapelia coarctata]|nr:hypothetical protein [Trapelia coarctata]